MSKKTFTAEQIDTTTIDDSGPIEQKANNKIWSRLVGLLPDGLARIHLSIQSKILLSFIIIIMLMTAINALLIVRVWQYNRRYDQIITNITTANSINGYINPTIDAEMWNIVSGRHEFNEGQQYQIINEVNTKIRGMMTSTDSDKARIKLEVILRTMDTLTHYVDLMGQQIAAGSTVAENEAVLENIRGVSDVVEDSVQEFMLFEVNRAGQNYQETQQNFSRWIIAYLILMVFVLAFSMIAAWFISGTIYRPIKKLHNVTTTITQNDLKPLLNRDNVDEITELGLSFNLMIGRIRELLDAKVKEQEALKKSELKVLQAQINPHFLYNTLDTIIWMAESRKTDDVIELVSALSSFFRTTLSKGQDWITLRKEIQHVDSYLTIQKMRYRDILDYSIEVTPDILDCTVLKLTLQPLVENALYHGIKNRREGGTITVRGKRLNQQQIQLEVIDDGVGFTAHKLRSVQEEINEDQAEIAFQERGFGLENVNKRLKLYHGQQHGLSIESEHGRGTRVLIIIPAQNGLTV